MEGAGQRQGEERVEPAEQRRQEEGGGAHAHARHQAPGLHRGRHRQAPGHQHALKGDHHRGVLQLQEAELQRDPQACSDGGGGRGGVGGGWGLGEAHPPEDMQAGCRTPAAPTAAGAGHPAVGGARAHAPVRKSVRALRANASSVSAMPPSDRSSSAENTAAQLAAPMVSQAAMKAPSL